MNATLEHLPARATALLSALAVTVAMLAGVDALASQDQARAVAQQVSCSVRG
jgi:hypothetical protein